MCQLYPGCSQRRQASLALSWACALCLAHRGSALWQTAQGVLHLTGASLWSMKSSSLGGWRPGTLNLRPYPQEDLVALAIVSPCLLVHTLTCKQPFGVPAYSTQSERVSHDREGWPHGRGWVPKHFSNQTPASLKLTQNRTLLHPLA